MGKLFKTIKKAYPDQNKIQLEGQYKDSAQSGTAMGNDCAGIGAAYSQAKDKLDKQAADATKRE